MKRIGFSSISQTTGQRFKSGTLQYLQLLPTEAYQAIIKATLGISNADAHCYGIHGCIPSFGGGAYTFVAGAVYVNGEIIRTLASGAITLAGANVLTLTITESSTSGAAYDPTTLTTGATTNAHFDKVGTWGQGLTGTGTFDYLVIRLDYSSFGLTSGAITLGTGAITFAGAILILRKMHNLLYFQLRLTCSSAVGTKDFTCTIPDPPMYSGSQATYGIGVGTFVHGVTGARTLLSWEFTDNIIVFTPFDGSTLAAFPANSSFNMEGVVRATFEI